MAPLTKYENICHPLYLIVSGGLNLPPVVFGAIGVGEWCNYYSNWLVGNAALTALNVVASFYCVRKIRKVARPIAVSAQNSDLEGAQLQDSEKDDSDTDSNSIENATGTRRSSPAATSISSPSSGCFSRLVHLRTSSSDRIRHLVCYDGIITTYAILFIFWVFWLSEGVQRMRYVGAAEDEELEGCQSDDERYVRSSLVCGFAYFSFVVVAGLASFCQ